MEPAPDVAPADEHVTRIDSDGRSIFIVGTAHVSPRSVEEVTRVITRLVPDTVCVELDQARYEALVDDSRFRRLDLFQIIREKRVLFLLASLALSAYQRRIGERMGVRPGAELLAAVEAARSVGAELVLADRDIQATLKRTWRSLGFPEQAPTHFGAAHDPVFRGGADRSADRKPEGSRHHLRDAEGAESDDARSQASPDRRA